MKPQLNKDLSFVFGGTVVVALHVLITPLALISMLIPKRWLPGPLGGTRAY